MTTFHGDAKFKEELLEEVRWHREQDKMAQGFYWSPSGGEDRESQTGCALGCTLRSYYKIQEKQGNPTLSFEGEKGRKALQGLTWDYAVADALDIPRELASFDEHIFESIRHDNKDEISRWPETFLSLIPVGLKLDDDRLDVLSREVWGHSIFQEVDRLQDNWYKSGKHPITGEAAEPTSNYPHFEVGVKLLTELLGPWLEEETHAVEDILSYDELPVEEGVRYSDMMAELQGEKV